MAFGGPLLEFPSIFHKGCVFIFMLDEFPLLVLFISVVFS